MKLITNPTSDTLVIPNVPAFTPGEQRPVTDALAQVLTNGTPLVVVETDKKPAKKPTTTA